MQSRISIIKHMPSTNGFYYHNITLIYISQYWTTVHTRRNMTFSDMISWALLPPRPSKTITANWMAQVWYLGMACLRIIKLSGARYHQQDHLLSWLVIMDVKRMNMNLHAA